jgi:Domain of unknown function (DUF4395)
MTFPDPRASEGFCLWIINVYKFCILSNQAPSKSIVDSRDMKLDPNVLRFNQIAIIAFLALAFAIQQPIIVAFVAIVMLVGTFFPKLALFKNLYASLVRPALGIAQNLVDDDPRAHNFAQGVGGVVLVLSSLAFVLGSSIAGWGLGLMVIVLAGLNLTTNICVGCFLYYQFKLARFAVMSRAG